jgi:hypothetical protein
MITSALHRAADWAKSVFSSAALGDPRRTTRLVNVAAQLAKCSGKSITISSEGSEAMQEGAYRFIRNPNVSAEAIRKAGAMQTVKLAQEFPEPLAIEGCLAAFGFYTKQLRFHQSVPQGFPVQAGSTAQHQHALG